jgi:RimJ/RimL family protein N-acetyltransferase
MEASAMNVATITPRAGMAGPGPREVGKLVLRAPRARDAEAVHRGLSDPHVARMLANVPAPFFRQDAVDWLAHDGGEPEACRAAITMEGDAPFGFATIGLRGGRHRLGFWLARAFWQRGIMTEALRALASEFFAAHPEAALHAGAFSDNRAGLRVQEKLGFRVVGLSQVYCTARSAMVDQVDTVLTADAFAATLH